jgi:hypothetical protein
VHARSRVLAYAYSWMCVCMLTANSALSKLLTDKSYQQAATRLQKLALEAGGTTALVKRIEHAAANVRMQHTAHTRTHCSHPSLPPDAAAHAARCDG